MTVRGIIFAMVELLFLTVALGTGIRELLVVAVCLGAVLLYSVLSILLAQLSIKATVNIDKTELYREDKLNVTLSLEGVALLPVTIFLNVSAVGVEGMRKATRRHAFSLYPSLYLNREYVFSLECMHKGNFKAGINKLRMSDLFGLVSFPLIRSFRVPLKLPITVFPAIHKIHKVNEKTATSEGFASTQIKSAERGELLGDTRLYMQGDSLKRIHWKQSARTRKLYTRQFEAQENPQVLIVLDASCCEDDISNVSDIICETATSLCKYYIKKNKSVRLVLVRSKPELDNDDLWIKNERDVYTLLNKLIGVSFHKEDEPLDLWQLKDVDFKSTSIVRIISNNPSASLIKTLNEIVSRGGEAACFVAQVGDQSTEAVECTLSSEGVRTVVLRNPCEICVKVGGAL